MQQMTNLAARITMFFVDIVAQNPQKDKASKSMFEQKREVKF